MLALYSVLLMVFFPIQYMIAYKFSRHQLIVTWKAVNTDTFPIIVNDPKFRKSALGKALAEPLHKAELRYSDRLVVFAIKAELAICVLYVFVWAYWLVTIRCKLSEFPKRRKAGLILPIKETKWPEIYALTNELCTRMHIDANVQLCLTVMNVSPCIMKYKSDIFLIIPLKFKAFMLDHP